MTGAREDRLERLFEQASMLPPEKRAAFVDEASGADEGLRTALRALVEDSAAAHEFGDRVLGPAIARVTGFLLGDQTHAVGDASSDALLGQQIAHFRLLEKLGGGGMGRVYKALDLKLDRTVALKLLPPHLDAEEDAKRRFAVEARAASALEHPNICAIHEIGETNAGQLFIAMAYCEGETLKQKIARGALPVSESLEYVRQVADGLQRAHRAGIVHRDVKPANVIVSDGGVVKIVDFGLAKMAGADVTRERTTIGTVAYMSPEQTRGDAVDARSDLWSLGAVFYEMLTAQRPFRSENDDSLIYAVRHDEPKSVRELRPSIPAAVAAIVKRCLEKDPARRYQSAGDLLADVQSTQRGGPVRRRVSAGRGVRYGAGAALLVAVILTGITRRARPEVHVRSLAVLPVSAFTDDSAQENLSHGMTDLLINHLSQLSGLHRVISRTSVTRYRNTQKSSRQIGRELGVDALVEMSVMRKGERVRITVNLVGAEAERVLWSRSFERPEGDVMTLQREVAQAIARELQLQLTPREAARMAGTAHNVDPEAFALYLQSVRVGDAARERLYLEQAIAKDSTFALAHARVAVSYIMRSNDKAKAERAIAAALASDPGLSDAHAALGLLRMWIDWDWPAAERAFREAIELDPHNSVAHHELGQLLMRLTRCDEAVAEEQRAILQNPGVAHFQSGLAEVYLYCRRYDDAVRELEKNLALVTDSAGTYFLLGDAYFYQGKYTQALSSYERTGWPVPGWAYPPLGRQQEVRKWTAASEDEWGRGGTRTFVAWNLARTHATLGHREQALTWLERTYDQRSGLVVYLKVHPQFDSLRGEPRFQSLLRKIGLAG
jgi:serine/threonine-protein kinase